MYKFPSPPQGKRCVFGLVSPTRRTPSPKVRDGLFEKPKEVGAPMERQHVVVGKGSLSMRDTRAQDPWDIVEVQINRNTVGDVERSACDPLQSPRGSYIFIPPTLGVPIDIRRLPIRGFYDGMTSESPESRTHSLGHTQ